MIRQKRIAFFPLLAVLTGSPTGYLAAAEIGDNGLSVIAEATEDNNVVEVGGSTNDNDTEVEPYVPPAQERRTVKMIVGGQSEDGVAKKVTVPVEKTGK